jgi:hypothetical protein
MVVRGANGQIELLEDRLIIGRRGFLRGLRGEKTIPYSSITAMQAREPGIFAAGYIQLTIPGGIESTKGLWDAWKDENTVVFRHRQRRQFREAREAIQQGIARSQAVRLPGNGSDLDQLEKLTALRTSGAVTEPEFQVMKARILESRASESPSGRTSAAGAAKSAEPGAPSRWRMLAWTIVIPVLLGISLRSPSDFAWTWATMAGLVVLGFAKPLPGLGIRKALSVIILILGVVFFPAGVSNILETNRLAELRTSDPKAYLVEVETRSGAEQYLTELKAMDPSGYDELIAKRDPKYLEALKSADPDRYKLEKDQIDAEQAAKRASEQAKADAERMQKEIAEKQRLEKLRSSDPKAYLDAIKGTASWESEFKTIDPKGYAAWQAEIIKKKVPELAYDPYTKAGYPKTFAKWGAAAVKEINGLRKRAAFLVATNPACDQVDISDLSDERSAPGKTIVIFVDCRNHQRFYLTEAEIKEGAKPVSKNQKTAMISDETALTACEAQVKAALQYPSSFDRSLLNTSVFRSPYGNMAVEFDFEAMNGFGNVVPQFGRCVIDDQGIHPAEISAR